MLQEMHNWRKGRLLVPVRSPWAPSRPAPARSPLDEGLAITIRHAYPDDLAALHQLAALDCAPVPNGPLLVAEVAGELWAAVAIDGDRPAIADPFHHTAALVELRRERAARLHRPRRRSTAAQPTTSVAWQ